MRANYGPVLSNSDSFPFCAFLPFLRLPIPPRRRGRLSRRRGGGGTSLEEAYGDVPLDGIAFSRLD